MAKENHDLATTIINKKEEDYQKIIRNELLRTRKMSNRELKIREMGRLKKEDATSYQAVNVRIFTPILYH